MPRKIINKPINEPLVERNIIIEKLNFIIEPLKARHRRHYRDSHFHFWADLILASTLIGLVIIVVWLLIWRPEAEFSLASHFTNARILSGQVEELVVEYKNEEGEAIKGVNLKLDLPANFIIKSAEPTEIFNKDLATFNLGDLKKNERGEVKLKGIVRGQINERQFVGLSLTYQFRQVNKRLLDSVIYHIDGSVMELILDVPSETYQKVSFPGSLEVKNIGEADLTDAALAFPDLDWEIVPDDLIFENGRLALPTIPAGQSIKINFSAVAKKDVGQKPLSVMGLLVLNDKVLNQVEQSKIINISEPSLELTGSFSEKALANNEVNLVLNFKNSGTAEINNLSLALENKRSTMAVTGISTTDNNFTVINNSLILNKSLAIKEEGSVKVLIKLEPRGSSLNDFLNLNLLVTYKMADKDFKYFIALPKLKINSNLTVTSAGYYYGPQGDQLGIGPLPPQVDIPTTYWVIWEANNLGNDVAEFEVAADLPINVVWLDQKSIVVGDISYSPVSRRVLWKIDKLSQIGGNYRASFAISLVPRNQDIGTEPILLSNIQFRGKDLYTGDLISKNLANITTNIEQDRKATGKSKVESLD